MLCELETELAPLKKAGVDISIWRIQYLREAILRATVADVQIEVPDEEPRTIAAAPIEPTAPVAREVPASYPAARTRRDE